MKLTENWYIERGPHGNDYILKYEHHFYNEEKGKWSCSKDQYYYPSFDLAVKCFVKYCGIEAVQETDAQKVIDKLEELRQTVIEMNKGE